MFGERSNIVLTLNPVRRPFIDTYVFIETGQRAG